MICDHDRPHSDHASRCCGGCAGAGRSDRRLDYGGNRKRGEGATGDRTREAQRKAQETPKRGGRGARRIAAVARGRARYFGRRPLRRQRITEMNDIVADASALLAVLLDEADAAQYLSKLLVARRVRISPVNWWEVQVRIGSRYGDAGLAAA